MNLSIRSGFPLGNNHWPLLFLVIAFLLFSSFVNGQTYTTGFSQSQVTSGLNSPTAIAFAPSSDGRIFVTEQGGNLRVIKNGTLLTAPAIQLNVDDDGERGLIGITLDPYFTTNHYVYLYYTVPSPVHNRVSRFTLNGDVVTAGSESIVLDLDALSSATNHNGGPMAFAPDGTLYVGVGENANGANAQNLDNYLGKLLRINSDGTVPSGNPYTTGSASRQRIWSYGLRNPYTFEFQPGTGKLYINDVGQSAWEEINDATTSGQNFGWPSAEGTSSNSAYANPVYAYGHGSGDGLGCAITGGTFFNPASSPYPSQYTGKYFFMDYCENWINYIDPTSSSPARNAFATSISGGALALTTGPDGNLYYLSRTNGALYKINYSNTTAIKPNQPNSGSIVYPQPAAEVLYVEMEKEFTTYSSVSFTDQVGATIYAPYSVEGRKLVVNVSFLPAGLYALKISDPNRTVTQQISVVK